MDIPIDMQNQAMGYDRAATMFSPDGHLLQVEYAEKAVRWGSASIGMVCSDGVLIIAHRRAKDNLVVEESANKIYEVDRHVFAAAAGILSDARVLIEDAQLLAQQNRVTYDSEISVESVIKEIANMKQRFTQYGGVRPFGVAVMIAGVSGNKPQLYLSDVTGNYFSYKAAAIGQNDDKIRDILKQEYKENMAIKDGVKLALKVFKRVLEKDYNISQFDIGYIKTEEKKLKRINQEELKKYE
ncbi:archaeal proteasome endopeptidase complex subunit alpha [Candidatus Pacearchaeota archaeon]|nr:archaeal proteasome endopeptidase complex subunit alpha [Candidatus Pacearchaeota archaeon]